MAPRKTIDQVNAQAGSRLLLHAIKRNVERVERRYRNKRTRELCQQFAHLCDEGLRMLDEDKSFAVFMSWQPTLPDYESTDEAYGDSFVEEINQEPKEYPF